MNIYILYKNYLLHKFSEHNYSYSTFLKVKKKNFRHTKNKKLQNYRIMLVFFVFTNNACVRKITRVFFLNCRYCIWQMHMAKMVDQVG